MSDSDFEIVNSFVTWLASFIEAMREFFAKISEWLSGLGGDSSESTDDATGAE